ncbi:hypothetical protein C0991_000695 [Blastosporella zonata]|nr:hypothetical protein C0991_000695 [Blastosporella zonata]
MTRSAIKKRTPALMVGLRKYNDLCATLATMYNPDWAIPLPEPLPTELKLLREDIHLMQDVWISRPTDEVPRWLQDRTLREAIRARIKLDRCQEEQCRLEEEATNLSQWYSRELAAVELALEVPGNEHLRVHLCQRYRHLLSLKARWTGPLLPSQSFGMARLSQPSPHITIASPSVSDHVQFEDPNQAAYIEDKDQGEDEYAGEDKDDPTSQEVEPAVAVEDLLLDDYLVQEAEHLESEADTSVLSVVAPSVDLVWELPVIISHPLFILCRSFSFFQKDLAVHYDLLDDLVFHTFEEFAPLSQPRIFVPLGSRRGTVFSTRELLMMDSPVARLNDVCINGIGALLHDRLSDSSRYSSGPGQWNMQIAQDLNNATDPAPITARYNRAEQGLRDDAVSMQEDDQTFLTRGMPMQQEPTGGISMQQDDNQYMEEDGQIGGGPGQDANGGPRYALRRNISLTPKGKHTAETLQAAQFRLDTVPPSPMPVPDLHPDLLDLGDDVLESLSFDCTSNFSSPLSGTGSDRDQLLPQPNEFDDIGPRDLFGDFLTTGEGQLPVSPGPSARINDPFVINGGQSLSPASSSFPATPSSSRKPGGRPSNATIAKMAATYDKIDQLFFDTSVHTNRSVDTIRKGYMARFKESRNGGPFNLYKQYYSCFSKEEVERSGLINGTVKDYYDSFMAEHGNLAENLMRAALDLNRIMNKKETQAQRARFFDKHRQKVGHINADGALNCIHTFSLIVAECMHEDANLFAIEASPGLATFAERLRLDDNTLIGLGKVTV